MKKDVVIKGLGFVNALGNNKEELWKNVDNDELKTLHMCTYPFNSFLEGSEKRRTTRQSELTMYTSEMAKKDYEIYQGKLEKEKVGTIFSSDCGPMNISLKFGKQVLEEDPNLVSPLLFTNSVANAMISTMCIKNGYKGVSTVLLESDSISYSMDLIKEGKAENIICGYTNDFCDELFSAYKEENFIKEYDPAESAVSLLIGEAEEGGESYCKICGIEEANLGFNPWSEKEATNNAQYDVEECIKEAIKCLGTNPDAIVLGEEGTLLYRKTRSFLQKNVSEAVVLEGLKELLGETGNGNFYNNVLLGALLIKNEKIPRVFKNSLDRPVKNVLTTGISRTGNYYVAALKSL